MVSQNRSDNPLRQNFLAFSVVIIIGTSAQPNCDGKQSEFTTIDRPHEG